MKIDVLDIKGEKKGRIDLPGEIFGAKINKQLMAQSVRVYLANKRQGTASTKTRAEVRGSGRKIWRQKGTGRARHGDRYAPIFVGGGVAHGPKPKDYSYKLPKKMKRQALFSALTTKLKEKAVLVVRGMEKIKPKTKEMVKMLENLRLKKSNGEKLKILFVLPKPIENIIRAGRNIPGITLTQAYLLNTYEVLNNKNLLFLEESIPVLEKTFLAKERLKKKKGGKKADVLPLAKKASGKDVKKSSNR